MAVVCGLKAAGTFVILVIQDGFESDCPERPKQSLPKVTSEASFRNIYRKTSEILQYSQKNIFAGVSF